MKPPTNPIPDPLTTGVKRIRSDITSTDSIVSTPDNRLPYPRPQNDQKPKTKKPKKKSDSNKNEKSLDEVLVPIETTLEGPNSLLNYIQLKSLLEKTKGSTNPREIAEEFSDNVENLVSFIKNYLYPLATDRSLKNRFTRLTNKITNQNSSIYQDQSSFESESDSSNQD